MRFAPRWALVLIATAFLSACASGLGTGLFSRDLQARPGVVNGQTAAMMISQYRATRGLGPVVVNAKLTRIATDHARRMAETNTMVHVLPGQVSFKRRIAAGGYRADLVAENIGAGYHSLEMAMARWQASPSHDKNLLLPRISEIGIAVAHADESRYDSYWALVLAAPGPQEPGLIPR